MGTFASSIHWGAKYYVTFIDDFSRKVWVILLEAEIRSILEVQGVKNCGGKSEGAKGESLEVRQWR